jgi:hypothetical protein
MRKKNKLAKPRSDYTVGYSRPPVATRFQSGQSGNPKGRPKGARNTASMAHDALERQLSIKENGIRRKMTVRQASYRRLADKAVAGDVKALDYLLSLEGDERRSHLPEINTSSEKDLEILQAFFDRRRASLLQQIQHNNQQHRADETEREDQ